MTLGSGLLFPVSTVRDNSLKQAQSHSGVQGFAVYMYMAAIVAKHPSSVHELPSQCLAALRMDQAVL